MKRIVWQWAGVVGGVALFVLWLRLVVGPRIQEWNEIRPDVVIRVNRLGCEYLVIEPGDDGPRYTRSMHCQDCTNVTHVGFDN